MSARSRASDRRLVPGGTPFILAALLALLVVPFLAPAARAQITAIEGIDPLDWEEEENPFIMYGITLFGTLSTVDMQQMNEALKIVNREIAAQGSFGVQFDPLERTAAMGAGIQLIIADRYMFRSDWERTIASTHVGGVTSESKVDIPADIFTNTLGYDFLSTDAVRFGFGVGLGWYSSRAEQIITETLTGQDEVELGRITMDGSTMGPVYQMFFEAKFTEKLFVGVTSGYRTAKVADLEIAGLDDIQDPRSDTAFISIPVAEEDDDGMRMLRGGGDSLDWTGFFGRASMTYYFNAPAF